MKLLQISVVANIAPLFLQTVCATVMTRPSLEKRETVYGMFVSLCSVQLIPCNSQRLKKLTRSMFLDTIVTVTEVRYVPMAVPSQAPVPAPAPARPAPQAPPQAGLFFFPQFIEYSTRSAHPDTSIISSLSISLTILLEYRYSRNRRS